MRIGIVSDLHAPFTHPMALKFCQDTFDTWEVDHVHFIGDLVDAHAISFFDPDPNGLSAKTEATKAIKVLHEWRTAFPVATVSIGNHDERHYRKARKAGIPDMYLRTYQEIYGTPGWDWNFQHRHDGVLYEHGTGSSGKDAAINRALAKRCSLVMGHVHSYPGVKYHANPFDRIFGLNSGCLLDIQSYAFSYGKMFPIRPVLGCGIVVDGEAAFFEPMFCGDREPYHRNRAPKKRRKPWIIT